MRNFGLLKEAYIEIMLEGLKTGDLDKKNTFKSFIKSLKKNPVLKKQAKVFSLLENISEVDDGMKDDFINEAISMFSETDKKKIINENIMLAQVLFEYNYDLTELNYEKKELHEAISNLLFLKPELKNVKVITESKLVLKNSKILVSENKKMKKDEDYLPTKTILKTAINKISKTYSDLSENEIKIVASVLNGNITEQAKIFNDVKDECIDFLNSRKDEIQESGLLETAIDRLHGMEYKQKTYQTDIVKMMSLKSSF